MRSTIALAPRVRKVFRRVAAVTAAMLLSSSAHSLAAQTPAEWVATGDKYAEARNATDALKAYDAALAAAPKDYAALWKAARTGVDLGEYEKDEAKRKALFTTAEQRARLAVQVDPSDAEGHFALARALGRTALSLGTRDRIKYATEIRQQALACLKIDPKHPGCLHVMGAWNAEVMRLNGVSRMIAKTFLGGQVFGEASWSAAMQYMVDAVKNDPRRIIHRLDLARIYVDQGMKAQARTQLDIVATGDLIDYNDPHYKAEAQTLRAKL